MDIFIQSLKRLYTKGLITAGDLDVLFEQGKISRESYDWIKQS